MKNASPKARRPSKPKKHHKACGKQQESAPQSTSSLIESIMAEPIETNLNGKTVSLTVFEAIVYQLIQKCAEGSVQAGAALLQLEEMSAQRSYQGVTVEFLEREDEGAGIDG